MNKRLLIVSAACALIAGCGSAASAVSLERSSFGTLDSGETVEAVTLTTQSGISATVITLGATLQALEAPDRDGKVEDIVLGYDSAAEYLETPQYFGSTIGRFGNRIAGGKFTLDGTEYQLETNDGPNHLHGGVAGFDKLVWTIAGTNEDGDASSVTMTLTSPDGAGGYPGTVEASVTYTLSEDGDLTIDHRATTDKTTIINMTNHSYFNLSGHEEMRPVLTQELMLNASSFTPVDATLIPTGEVRSVEGTPFDFREATVIGDRIRTGSNQQIMYGLGYDHNFVLDGYDGELQLAATVYDADSGRQLDILSDAPSIQFYSGNFLDGSTPGKGETLYRQGDALCLEPQVYPDAPNKPDFPSARLEPGEEYSNVMVFRMSTR